MRKECLDLFQLQFSEGIAAEQHNLLPTSCCDTFLSGMVLRFIANRRQMCLFSERIVLHDPTTCVFNTVYD